MEAKRSHNTFPLVAVCSLLTKIEQTTGYQNLFWEARDGGVYLTHPSGIPICYATIRSDGSLDKELYYPGFEERIAHEEFTTTYMASQIDRETMGQLSYQRMLDEKKEKILTFLQQRQKRSEALESQKRNSISKKKVPRKRNVKYIVSVILSASILILIGVVGKRLDNRQEQYSLITDYVGEDTNILNQNTSRINNNKDYLFHNASIANAIVKTGKKPWPLLFDLLTDMGHERTSNFPVVVDYLYDMDYFPYDYETLVILANAQREDGSCDFEKLAQYIREVAVYEITEQKKEEMTEQEKEQLTLFLNSFSAYIGEVETLNTSKGMGI